jgi:hypothetical protein
MSDPMWDADENGLIIQVVTRYTTALLAQAGPILRIEYASRQDPIGAPKRSIQLGMTVKLARELAADLIELADAATQVPPGTVPS